MTAQENTLNRFEISVTDLNRAKKLYETIFEIKLDTQNIAGMDMALFPADDGNGKVSGALVKSDQHKPSGGGAKIYLNGNPDLAGALGKVEKAGGKVIMAKTKIDDNIGAMAFFIDTEGNVMGLHSNK